MLGLDTHHPFLDASDIGLGMRFGGKRFIKRLHFCFWRNHEARRIFSKKKLSLDILFKVSPNFLDLRVEECAIVFMAVLLCFGISIGTDFVLHVF